MPHGRPHLGARRPRPRSRAAAGLLAVGVLTATLTAAPGADAQSPTSPYQRQPLGLGGAEPNGFTTGYAASADGSMVVLNSYADNLVLNDTNGLPDALVWNRRNGTVVRQPLGVNGEQPNGRSLGSAISADGIKVTIVSEADNLVPNWPFTNTGDESEFAYVWDLLTGRVTPQPVNSTACKRQGSITFPYSVAPDGSTVALYGADCSKLPGDTTPTRSVQLWTVATGRVEPQPAGVGGAEPNGGSEVPVLSADGTKVVMQSYASNLVKGDTANAPDLNGEGDVYVWNRSTGTYQRQSPGLNGAQPDGGSRPTAITRDNSKILLSSYATNLVAGDTNGRADVFVWNRWNGTYQRQARGIDGLQPNDTSFPFAMSADGARVLLVSSASNLVAGDTNGLADVFVWDRVTGRYTRQPNGLLGAQPNGETGGAGAISADGTVITLSSYASNLVPGDTNGTQDAFVWTLPPTAYQRQPLGVGGTQPNGRTLANAVSGDGRLVLLTSIASNLVPGDADGHEDVFVWDRLTGKIVRQPLGVGGAEPDRSSFGVAMSADGTRVSFDSQATNLVAQRPLTNALGNTTVTYVWDLTTGAVTTQPQTSYNCPLPAERPKATQSGTFSADGTRLAITSDNCTLTPGDVNGLADVYVWTPATGAVARQPRGVNDAQPNGESRDAVLSPDGSKVAFQTDASNLVRGDTANTPDRNGRPDTYVWNRSTGAYERPPPVA